MELVKIRGLGEFRHVDYSCTAVFFVKSERHFFCIFVAGLAEDLAKSFSGGKPVETYKILQGTSSKTDLRNGIQ